MRRPVPVEPVNATLSTSMLDTSVSPAPGPKPGITLTTPSGIPASFVICARSSAVSGVFSLGFSTTVFPAAIAGAIFHAAISSGKFHGMICPATPTGATFRFGNAYSSLSAQPA